MEVTSEPGGLVPCPSTGALAGHAPELPRPSRVRGTPIFIPLGSTLQASCEGQILATGPPEDSEAGQGEPAG